MGIDLPATLTFVVVTTFTPGPNNILSASMGALFGYRRTLPFLVGITSGFLVIMLGCATLSSAVTTLLPRAVPVLRLAGAAYILWLAIGVYRTSRAPLESQESTRPLRFLHGMALQLVNPKGVLFGLTIYSVFLVRLLDEPLTFLWSPLVLASVAFAAVSAWALGGHAIQRRLSTPGRSRMLGIVLAGALIVTALDLAGVLPW